MIDMLRIDLLQQIKCGITIFMHAAARICSGDDLYKCVLSVYMVFIRATLLVATAVLIFRWLL